MKPAYDSMQQLLFLYIEEQERGTLELSAEEKVAVEAALKEDDALQREAERIRQHLRWHRTIPVPPMADDLPSRCLAALSGRRASRWPAWRTWGLAGACTVLMVLLVGIWIGQKVHRPPTLTFNQLVQVQHYYLERLEENLARRYDTPILMADNPWYPPMETLLQSSQAIEEMYQKYPDNRVIGRGLSIAIAQNISVLKSLCDYIETHETIPDFDYELLDTSKELPEKSI